MQLDPLNATLENIIHTAKVLKWCVKFGCGTCGAQLAEIHNIAWSANVHTNISCLSVEGSANYACVEASMPNVDGCILSAYQSCRIGLDGLKVSSSEIDRMLLDKFTELVSNN